MREEHAPKLLSAGRKALLLPGFSGGGPSLPADSVPKSAPALLPSG